MITNPDVGVTFREYEAPSLLELRVLVPEDLVVPPHSARRAFRQAVISGGYLSLVVVATAASVTLAYVRTGVSAPSQLWYFAAILACVRLWAHHHRTRGQVPRVPGIGGEFVAAIVTTTAGSLAVLPIVVVLAPSPQSYVEILKWEWGFHLLIASTLFATAKVVVGAARRRGRNTRNVLVMGRTSTARRLVEHLVRSPESGYRLAAMIPDRQAHGVRGADDRHRDLTSLIDELHIDEVVLASAVPRHELIRILATSPSRFGIKQLAHALDSPAIRSATSIAGFPVLDLLPDHHDSSRAVLKRLMDVGVASVALIVLSPLLLGSVVAIRLTSRGSALFKQVRIGLHGRPFTMYKLRTMTVDDHASAHEAYVARLVKGAAKASDGTFKTNEPNVTRVGRFLRKYSIDELPQLYNVLNGTMSLVGPRPPMPYEIPLHDARQLRRLDVRPGATGRWQVSGRNRLGYREMIDLDLDYIDKWTLFGDFVILLRTPAAVLRSTDTA